MPLEPGGVGELADHLGGKVGLVGLYEHAEDRLVPAVLLEVGMVRHLGGAVADQSDVRCETLPLVDEGPARRGVLDGKVGCQELWAPVVLVVRLGPKLREEVALGKHPLLQGQGVCDQVMVAQGLRNLPEIIHVAELRPRVHVNKDVALPHVVLHQVAGERRLPKPIARALRDLQVAGPLRVVLDEVREVVQVTNLAEELGTPCLPSEALLSEFEALPLTKGQHPEFRRAVDLRSVGRILRQ
mmetsp:Transcript_77299/g.205170  ORF Transcript_77299/g.205170 Transcript_77299/m.205170 type:complete len:242 (-) Transcript_77299:209-934(-)